jgi:hypothetical protein
MESLAGHWSLWNTCRSFFFAYYYNNLVSGLLQRRRDYQESWSLKYTWCQQDPSGTGNFDKVKCITYSRVNGHNLFLDAKGDNLKKHEGWTTAKIDKPSLGK